MENPPLEPEIIQTEALAVRPTSNLPTVQDLEQQFALAVRQRELLSEYIKKQLVPGKHFYQRGTQKPSLAKEGAEIILLPHNLAPDYEQTGGPTSPPADNRPYQITVKCILRRKGDPDSFVGSGIGSAGSEHQKKDGTYTPRQSDKYLCHNATLKMAQKSAMIAATINSTAASEFFTQDMDPDTNVPPPKPPPQPPRAPTVPKPVPFPTAESRTKMIAQLEAGPGEPNREFITEFFRKLTWLAPFEKEIEDLELRYVPATMGEMRQLSEKLSEFGNGEQISAPYNPHDEPGKATAPSKTPKEDEAWRDVIVPIPPKGMKRADYLKNPQTIGQLFDMRHGDDEESQAARQRLWGFVNHFEAKLWTGNDGKQRPPSDTDVKFRESLDQFAEWFERNHPGEKL